MSPKHRLLSPLHFTPNKIKQTGSNSFAHLTVSKKIVTIPTKHPALKFQGNKTIRAFTFGSISKNFLNGKSKWCALILHRVLLQWESNDVL